jgi:hypothetical protein
MTKLKSTEKVHRRPVERPTLYGRIGDWCSRHSRRCLFAALAIGLIASLAQFDVKPSIGGDDTSYVLQAMDFVSNGQLPASFRTPGYPLMLAFFVWIVGVKLVLLKMTSLLSFLVLIGSFFVVFKKRLEPMVFYPTLFLLALNPLALEYSYQTYSEMLFSALAIWSFHFIMKSVDGAKYGDVILAAGFTMAAFYVRVVGVTIAAAAVLYFILERRWKTLILYVIICGVLYSPLKIQQMISGTNSFGQASILLLKNPYNATLGNETMAGFVDRAINNLTNHLNYQIPVALSLPTSDELAGADGRLFPSGIAMLAVACSLLVLAGMKTTVVGSTVNELKVIAIFLAGYVAFICLALQNLFATPRMMMPVIPYLTFMFLLGWRWILLKAERKGSGESLSNGFKTVFMTGVLVVMVLTTLRTVGRVNANYPILKANLSGDEFAGFTDDWANYLKTSRWIGQNLPKVETKVICRKPELFQIYNGGYVAYGAYQIDQTDPDSILAKWKRMKLTHLLYDNFQWSSTLRRYVQPVAEKFPKLFSPLHQEGRTYPSYVFRLDYDSVQTASGDMRQP